MRITRIVIMVFGLFASPNINAQDKDSLKLSPKTEIKFVTPPREPIVVPKFKGNILVLRTIEYASLYDPTLTISDGSADTFALPLLFIGNLHEADYTKTLATVLNQLQKQGFKLIASNSGGTGDVNWTMLVTAYIFQRE